MISGWNGRILDLVHLGFPASLSLAAALCPLRLPVQPPSAAPSLVVAARAIRERAELTREFKRGAL